MCLESNRGGSGAFVKKNLEATSWHELLHEVGPFLLSVAMQPNSPKCTHIVRNAPKYEFRYKRGQSGVFDAKT